MKLLIPGMSCGNCVANKLNAVKVADPAAIFRKDLALQTAEIATTVPSFALTQILAESSYPSTNLEDGQS